MDERDSHVTLNPLLTATLRSICLWALIIGALVWIA